MKKNSHVCSFLLTVLAWEVLVSAALMSAVSCSDKTISDDSTSRHFAYIVNEAWVLDEAEAFEVPTTRTDFDSHVGKFEWTDGDKIAIHMTNGTFYETPVAAGTGLFTCSTTATIRRNMYAVYPASVRDAANYGDPTLNIVLPAAYDMSGALSSDFSPVPMVAVNQDAESDLYFRHVGGLIRLTCDGVPAGTKTLAVTLDRNIAGTFAVSGPATDAPSISDGGSGATVTFTVSADGLAAATDGIILNIPVPTGAVTSIQVDASDGSSILSTLTRAVSLTVIRSHGKKYLFTLPAAASPSGDDPVSQGIFSVSDSKRVQFSPGNLQAVLSGGGTNVTWRFAEHQWDYAGNNHVTADGQDGLFDLFGWSGSDWDHYGVSLLEQYAHYSGDSFKDWGANPALVSVLGEGWFTLSADEYEYLVGDSAKRDGQWGYAGIGGIAGAVILPDADVWIAPAGAPTLLSAKALVELEEQATTEEEFEALFDNIVNYTPEEWGLMEGAGAVFLPIAGGRGEHQIHFGESGYYWTATPRNSDQAYTFTIKVDEGFTEGDKRYYGYSVRLVRLYTE